MAKCFIKAASSIEHFSILNLMSKPFKLVSPILLSIILWAFKTNAQTIPDSTLGTENSTVRSVNQLRDRIEGGATRGANLFHSFEQFIIQEGINVGFANPEGIENIFSRVTGTNASEILGTLSVEGNANLFLLNPNGIVFGENAVVDVGGSFMATTAEEINFNNGDRFSSVEPGVPTVTIDFPIGLGLGSNPGDIKISGEQNNALIEIPSFKILADNLPPGIEVNSGNNITLVGGNINLNGGGVKAPGGNIEIFSIGSSQDIDLLQNNDWFALSSERATIFGDIGLNGAYVDVSAEEAGNISIDGNNITIDGGSSILSNTTRSSDGRIDINATGVLELKGSSGENQISVIVPSGSVPFRAFEGESNLYSISVIGADIENVGSGSNSVGNGVNINAQKIEIFDAGQIRTVSFSDSADNKAGDINILSNDILVEGNNNIDGFIGSVINSTSGIGTFGNSGDVNINTSSLRVRNGGRIKADTFGRGLGGKLTIEANDIVLESILDESSVTSRFRTGLSVSPGRGNGTGGAINIKSKNLSLSRAEIISSNFKQGVSGNINIDSEQLNISGGADIVAETTAGNSGNIDINAQNIELDGTRSDNPFSPGGISTSTLRRSFGKGGDVNIQTESLKIKNGAIVRAISLGRGDAGNINIDAETVEISGVDSFAENPAQSKRVSKINTGAAGGNGGSIKISSDSIKLDEFGIVSASSTAGDRGGNINLDTSNLTVRGQSRIAASAGAQGDGGNIEINSDTILGIENSDIVANAAGGRGGNIAIDSNSVLGLEARSQATPFSDITASSELGIDGTVIINSPDGFINEESLTAFEEISFDSAKILVDGSCINPYRRSAAGTIIDRGRGGIPESPDSYFDESESMRSQPKPTDTTSKEIIEANRVVKLPNGSVELVAQTPEQSFANRLCMVRSREK